MLSIVKLLNLVCVIVERSRAHVLSLRAEENDLSPAALVAGFTRRRLQMVMISLIILFSASENVFIFFVEYIFPDLKKVLVTINGSPNMLYNNGIESEDAWRQVNRFFMKEKHKPQHMPLKKFYAEDKFGLLIDLHSMASQKMHGSGTRLVNITDGVQLEIKRSTGKGPFNCHIFVISDAQFSIQNRQLDSVMY